MSPSKKIRILSIDGGGIRGVIPAFTVKYIEDYLKSRVPNTTIADYFDLIAGTSTGGILTCIYLTPEERKSKKAKYNATDALDFYIKEGYNIFNAAKEKNIKRFWGLKSAAKYRSDNIENIFLRVFGDTHVSDLIKPSLITTYNMDTKTAFFFTSHCDTEYRDFYVRDAARSTSSAPTYFNPPKIKNLAPKASMEYLMNLDGSVFATNPSMCAYAEARKTNFQDRGINQPTASQISILSLGTGAGFDLIGKEKSNQWNLLKWAESIPEIMMEGSCETVDFQMQQLYKTLKEEQSTGYLRLNLPIEFRKFSPDIADASSKNIQALLDSAKKGVDYARENQNLDGFLDKLLE
ncbi:patatin-like phospholipase family protein [Sediminitomix flava]|uniref:Patatin-like phospholipase/acyl hydrolase n=1 Tax=Sediminitomix flava TaxID=379075 RepID=A0A315Z6P5_SEDFL|nr:patatin-like phospholipase family protein [Sediminitomix flava]PWJ38640.1 patatin-like phospholipase/acyl hydrolase [Sediminitomix flava]